MPSVRIRLKDTAPENVRFHTGSTYDRSFSKNGPQDTWVVTQEEFDKILGPSGYFEVMTGNESAPPKVVEKPSWKVPEKTPHFDVGRIK
jgi:hypothetical protein